MLKHDFLGETLHHFEVRVGNNKVPRSEKQHFKKNPLCAKHDDELKIESDVPKLMSCEVRMNE